MLDIWGESTRPGAQRIPAAEQIRRVVPLIAAIRSARGPAAATPISIDTTLSDVARAALDAGADAINDVASGAEDAEMLPLAAERGAGIILMHRLAAPPADSYSDGYARAPEYGDVVATVRAFLAERASMAERAGVARGSIAIDPGLGFGKSVEQNMALLRRTDELIDLGYPVVSALSRKSFVGRVGLGRDSDSSERLPATLALSVLQAIRGAALFRVHDVAEHVQALRAARAFAAAPGAEP
jgi:dihydropteroate synthase